MSDSAGGPGWWVASDGRWYPPQTASVPVPPPAVGTTPGGVAPTPDVGDPAPVEGTATPPPPSNRGSRAVVALVVAAVVGALVGAGLTWWLQGTTTYVGAGVWSSTGYLCHDTSTSSSLDLFVSWQTSGGHLQGSIKVGDAETLTFTGTRKANTIHLAGLEGTETGSMQVSGDTLTVRLGHSTRPLHCTLETSARALVQLKTPTTKSRVHSGGHTATQSDLVNSLESATATYVDEQSFPPSTTALISALAATQRTIAFTAGPARAGANSVSVDLLSTQVVALAAEDGGGGCWVAVLNESSGSYDVAPDDVVAEGDWFGFKKTSTCTASDVVRDIHTHSSTGPIWTTWQQNFKALDRTST